MAGERLVDIMNKVRKEEKNDTTDLIYGVVTAVNPLKIKVENRFEITEEFILLSAMCKQMTVNIFAHAHEITTNIEGVDAHTHGTPAGTTGAAAVGDHGIHTHTIPAATTNSNGAHTHAATSSENEKLTSVTLWRGLEVNDKVRMLRVSKGQLYYVLEREEGIV